MTNCRDCWNNFAKVNITEDEHAVLFMGYSKGEIARLHVDARNFVVRDSACGNSVYGRHWLDAYLKSQDSEERNKIYQTGGAKKVQIWRET